MITIEEIKNRDDAVITALVDVWESAVRATHFFLSPAEIESIKQYVPIALREVPHLLIAQGERGEAVGFLGICEQKVEMLFVAAQARGHGIGKKLMNYAIEHYGAREVTVNEENPQARGFYEHLGFVAVGYSALDEQGNPHPILHLQLP